MAKVNWDDPRDRVRRLAEVGRQQFDLEYNAHIRASIVEVCNGYQIRSIRNRYGATMYMIIGLGFGHATLEGARAIARDAPPGRATTVH